MIDGTVSPEKGVRIATAPELPAEQESDARMAALARVATANYHRYVPDALAAIELLQRAEVALREINDPALARTMMYQGMVLSDLGVPKLPG